MRITRSLAARALRLGIVVCLALARFSHDGALAAPRTSASPVPAVDVLPVEQATHVANPLFTGSPVPQSELHGTFTVRNAAHTPAINARLMVRLQEHTCEYDLGSIAAGATATTEWSLLRTGVETTPVKLELTATLNGRRLRRRLESREVLPPSNQGPPGGPPPGY